MAIGTLAAIGIGLAGVGSAVSAHSQSKAAGKAADTSLQVAQQNNALAREIYGKNEGYLSPYVARGNVAGNALMDFYGLTPRSAAQTPGATGQQTLPAAQPNALAQFQGANPDTSGVRIGRAAALGSSDLFYNPRQLGMNNIDAGYPGAVAGLPGGIPGAVGLPANGNTGVVGPQVPQTQQQGQMPSSADAFKRFIQNSDYAFQFGEGANRVNSGYAGAGTLQSGAAMKALEDYRQNLQSGYRNEWASGVANQQGVGLGAASALAGVGQNYVGQVSQNNNNAGTAAANAALAKGANNPFANALGMIGGGILGMGR